MKTEFNDGIALGKKHYAKIVAKGDRWKKRHVPAYVREHLMIPYYITERDGFKELYVIQAPIQASDKVSFIAFARSAFNEKAPEVPDS